MSERKDPIIIFDDIIGEEGYGNDDQKCEHGQKEQVFLSERIIHS